MPDLDLHELRSSLLENGASRRYVGRLMSELEDHYADLEEEERERGRQPGCAALFACKRLGDQDAIRAAVISRPELQSWPNRWPWIVSVLRPVVLILLLPSVPVLACAERGPAIARWSASISLATLLTVTLLFAMARAIFVAL
jgi:hypothetical protein